MVKLWLQCKTSQLCTVVPYDCCFWPFPPNGGARFKAITPQVLAPFHKLPMFSFYNSCFCVFTQPPPPCQLFLEGSNLSQLLSVSRHAASCCMCASVSCGAGFISSFISRPAPSSPGSCCLFSFFPYFHTLGHTCSSLSLTLSPLNTLELPSSSTSICVNKCLEYTASCTGV